MANNSGRLLSTLLLTGMLGGTVSLIASGMTGQYLDAKVSQMLVDRAPYEKLSLEVFNRFEAGSQGMLKHLETLSGTGFPLGNVLLMTAYSRQGDIQAQERLLLQSMTAMDDPDLLLLLTYGRDRFEDKAQLEATTDEPESSLMPNDRLWLNACLRGLQERYSGQLGAIRGKYAYVTHTRSCLPAPFNP